VNGQRINSSRSIKIFDPVTGEELANVSETQKDGLDRAVKAAKAAFPLWSSKTWNERNRRRQQAPEKERSEAIGTIAECDTRKAGTPTAFLKTVAKCC
jgi:betaine-aldehyde dehydrogenase